MNDTITVVGNLATPPETKHLPDGTPVTSFRLASSRRKFDTGAGRFVDVDANYYTVSAYREFGQHVAQSLTKGSRVVVTGRLRLRSWQSEHGWCNTSQGWWWEVLSGSATRLLERRVHGGVAWVVLLSVAQDRFEQQRLPHQMLVWPWTRR